MPTSDVNPVLIRDDLYECESSTSANRKYYVTFGQEGEYFSCTCTGWATSRNKAGGIGFKGKCKHVTAVEAVSDLAKKARRDSQAKDLLRMVANLQK